MLTGACLILSICTYDIFVCKFLGNPIDVLSYWAWRHKNITRPKPGSHFVGQKRNKITRFSPIYQYSNQVFENEEQLLNIEIEHIRKF